MRILILGAPGAGKGTQSEIIRERLGIPHISTGDILRAEVLSGSSLGEKIKGYIDSGNLVPDEIIAEVLLSEISKPKYQKGYILDGFPRNINQVRIIEEKNIQIDKVIFIDTSEDLIMKRITGRRSCTNCSAIYNIYYSPPKIEGVCDKCGSNLIQRNDDKEEVVRRRLEIFKNETMPVVEYYQNKRILLKVDGNRNLDDIKNEIFSLLGV
ncbi:MAG: adenylate kinase [Spirochaetia bacterium]|nr:adenylate kinase [Spirochaetota bacterium]MCX8096694.1 adenylate kinase [Spirochaetota bacterium]MDW8112350.1 adenylate kinase [Spirochaetia bacterium]